jgi:hypothetical protein
LARIGPIKVEGEGLRTGVIADLLSARWDPGDAGLAGVWLPVGFEVEYAEPGGRVARTGLDRLRRVDLGSCLPVRSFPSFKGQRNYPGWFWSSTMGRHVGFESWVERGLIRTIRRVITVADCDRNRSLTVLAK